jgi:hypothetical protein
MKTVAISDFVRRQTPESPFSHYDGDLDMVRKNIELAINDGVGKQGYREGVLLIEVSPENFYTGIVELQEGDQLVGEYTARQSGETPRISIYVSGGKKQPAKSVEVVLYSHAVLAENKEQSSDADYEIIAINAVPTEVPAPIAPNTLMHNHFGSSGGTDTGMSAEEFEAQMRESFLYWKDKGMLR